MERGNILHRIVRHWKQLTATGLLAGSSTACVDVNTTQSQTENGVPIDPQKALVIDGPKTQIKSAAEQWQQQQRDLALQKAQEQEALARERAKDQPSSDIIPEQVSTEEDIQNDCVTVEAENTVTGAVKTIEDKTGKPVNAIKIDGVTLVKEDGFWPEEANRIFVGQEICPESPPRSIPYPDDPNPGSWPIDQNS